MRANGCTSRHKTQRSRAVHAGRSWSIDGDSFAHRAYHALPKTIRARDRKAGRRDPRLCQYAAAASIEAEQPRAVLVGWDTLDAPTYRHKAFPPTRAAASSTTSMIEQLDVLPQFVAACGFANAKAAGYEADDFLAAAVAAEERRGGTALVASGDRDTFQLASDHDHHSVSGARRRNGAHRPGRGARALRRRARAGAGFHRPARRSVRQAAGRAAASAPRRRHSAAPIRHAGEGCSRPAACRRKPTSLRMFRHRDHGPARRRCRRCAIRSRSGTRPRRSRGTGSSTSSRIGSTSWRNTKDRENNQNRIPLPPP